MTTINEFSAGGIITKEKKILLVLMKNLSGKNVWTYPKGHIEKNENSHQAALREVYEETGIKCEIIEEKEIYISKYSFTRNENHIEKQVRWYLMKPIEDTGKIQTPQEILKIKWVYYDEALKLLEYQSDREILEIVKSKNLVQ